MHFRHIVRFCHRHRGRPVQLKNERGEEILTLCILSISERTWLGTVELLLEGLTTVSAPHTFTLHHEDTTIKKTGNAVVITAANGKDVLIIPRQNTRWETVLGDDKHLACSGCGYLTRKMDRPDRPTECVSCFGSMEDIERPA